MPNKKGGGSSKGKKHGKKTADGPSVNGQVTDAVTQTNVKVVAEAPAQSMGMLYQMATHAAGLSMQNAVQNQQGLNQISTATVATAVSEIMKLAGGSTTPGE